MNGGDVGFGGTMIILEVLEQNVLSDALERSFERDVMAEQVFQHR